MTLTTLLKKCRKWMVRKSMMYHILDFDGSGKYVLTQIVLVYVIVADSMCVIFL